jgi:hypothetical protein
MGWGSLINGARASLEALGAPTHEATIVVQSGGIDSDTARAIW